MPDNAGERLADGEAFASAIQEFLASDNPTMISERSGLELSQGLSPVLAAIQKSGNAMERRLRFNPDGRLYLTKKGLSHWEAKASIYIERAPYEWYMKYEENGEPVLLFICPGLRDELGQWRHVWVGRVKNLVLQHGDDTETEWFLQGMVPRHVDDDGWISPRHDPRGPPKGSGTPFRKILPKPSNMLRITRATLKSHGSRDRPGECAIDYDFLVSDSIARNL